MSKNRTGLHKLTIENIVQAPVGRHHDGGGLYLVVKPSGKSWQFRYNHNGKQTWMGLGPVKIGRLSENLDEVRAKARYHRDQLNSGHNPLKVRKEAQEAQNPTTIPTFQRTAEDYIKIHAHSWKNEKHEAQWTSTLNTYAYPIIGKLGVDIIGVTHIEKILRPIWKKKYETAKRVRGRIEAILDYAGAKGFRALENNPARQKLVTALLGRRKVPVKHHSSIPYQELPDFMSELLKRDDLPALALVWIVFTCVRSSEGRGALKSEINKDMLIWTIPDERMKKEKEHKVPLSEDHMEILERLPKTESDFLFPGQIYGQCISETSLRDVLRNLGILKEQGSIHGFRSSFRTWAAEMHVPDQVAEACLAHSISDKVVAAYQRSRFEKDRRNVMIDWAAFLKRKG